MIENGEGVGGPVWECHLVNSPASLWDVWWVGVSLLAYNNDVSCVTSEELGSALLHTLRIGHYV